MIKVTSLKYGTVHLLFLSSLVSLTLVQGSFDTVSKAKCEYEDANLIWRNTPTYSLSDVKAMAWYKGKGSLIATWLDGKGFVEYPPYIGRLMQIGDTEIKIRTANRYDSGTYWLSLTLASVDHKLEVATHLEVRVAPSSLCKPRIIQEGSLIEADLPPEGCGIPQLTLKWKHTNGTIIQEQQNSSSVLDMRANPAPREYMVCADGESAICYQGNISDLCTRFTIPTSDHGSTPGVGPIAYVIPLLAVVLTMIVLVLVLNRHRISYRNKCSCLENAAENEIISCKEENKSKDYEKELPDIEMYLRELYEGLVTIPLSPSGEEEHYVNVSEVYVNIAFRKVEITDLDNGESNASSDPPLENEPLIIKDQAATNEKNQFSPILMFGDCGSGKSTWCKHLVQCWLQRSNIKDVNIEVLNLPHLRNIKILLYLPLQFSDRGISFQELMNKHIFKEKSTYLEFAMNYIKRNAQKVLVVMDGLDIIRENITLISDILNHKYMSSCHVILTSRPASLKLLQDKCHVKIEQMRLFRVSKMTPENSKACAISILKHLNHLHGKNYNVVNFWRFTEHLQVNHLLRVPYICLVLLHMWIKNENCFTKITDILLDIIYHYLRRATLDQQRKIFIENVSDRKSKDVQKDITKLNKWNLPKEHGYLLHVLCRLAAQIFYSATEKESSKLKIPQKFLITDEDDLDLQRICEIGLLTEPLSLSDKRKVSNMSFPDSIICEYFVSIFIALQEGKDYDFIVSSENVCLQNSMIIHILFQFSDTLIKDMMDKASKSFEKESTNTMGHEKSNDLSEQFRYRITCSDANPVPWLQWLMYNNTLHAKQLLFLSTALHCIDKVTSLELENHENNENLVLQLPCLSVLEILTLDINKCTLLLCKEWDNRIPKRLKEVAIKSVKVNTGTLGLLTKTLGLCPELEKLELFPSVIWSDDNDNLSKRPELANYSWNELSKHIQNNKKLKTLNLNGLNLIGVVDTFLSRFNRYENLETLILKNVSSISQVQSPLLHSSGTDRGSDDDVKENRMKLKLTHLSLERLKLVHSPIGFLFDTRNKGKSIKNNLKVLSISALQMPEKSWEILGSQIGILTLSEFHLSSVNPGHSLQMLLDGISMCKNLECLSLYKIETGKKNPDFSFLAKIKQLSQFKLREMQLDRPSSFSLFKEICGCKQLQTLSLCNIEVEEIPDTLSSIQKLTKLSVLIVDRVTITGESSSLSDFLNAFSKCKNLQTLYVSKEIAVSIPSKLLSASKVI